ncbi:MAG: hypothetical protein AVDCRST_MAG73-2307 [uncultured Thermomicrobiales bacterium]|uniref:Uncharacterized protein n=1 Tax=uncultured Thermomicrobiales bacterium TaxID=1645740 RepID=A0A6J4UA62_9BACT|nr:MAG: hypothetical protein AVDCRST_MAG73-2307 [uncultured Thermomicrobiales bacterium]
MNAPAAPDPAAIAAAVAGLDWWFDGMRIGGPFPGYGGPVVHWWNHCLAYQGAGLDWRYEGIVAGYLTLWRRFGDRSWLDKARRAGDDLVAGQLPDGHFRNSGFERNPGTGGTPHEVAADVALLLLAQALAGAADPAAARYLAAARANLEAFAFGQLWHAPTATLWDAPGAVGFVPNKAATFAEATMLLAAATGDDALVERYAVPTAERIVGLQIRRFGDPLDGAIAQNVLGTRVVEKYFPLYIARCVPALLQVAERTGQTRFRDAAVAAARFLVRIREPDGGFPQVLYPRGRRNRYPRWIAGQGDIVRALSLVAAEGAPVSADATVAWILGGTRPDGRIATANGFGRVVPGRGRRDRFADEVGVVGWCDKAFRALAAITDRSPTESDATFAAPVPTPRVVAGVVR